MDQSGDVSQLVKSLMVSDIFKGLSAELIEEFNDIICRVHLLSLIHISEPTRPY